MQWDVVIQTCAALIAVLVAISGAAVGIVVYIRSKVRRTEAFDNAKAAKDAIESMQATVQALKEQDILKTDQLKKQSAQIAELGGKVDTLSTIPLAKIEKHMADTNQILTALLPLIPKTIEHVIKETSE